MADRRIQVTSDGQVALHLDGATRFMSIEQTEGLIQDLIAMLDEWAKVTRKVGDDPKLDAKFWGRVYKAKDGTRVPDEEWCVFLAKDDLFAATILVYAQMCGESSYVDEAQRRAIDAMRGRVNAWRTAHPDRCKLPDAAGERLLVV